MKFVETHSLHRGHDAGGRPRLSRANGLGIERVELHQRGPVWFRLAAEDVGRQLADSVSTRCQSRRADTATRAITTSGDCRKQTTITRDALRPISTFATGRCFRIRRAARERRSVRTSRDAWPPILRFATRCSSAATPHMRISACFRPSMFSIWRILRRREIC